MSVYIESSTGKGRVAVTDGRKILALPKLADLPQASPPFALGSMSSFCRRPIYLPSFDIFVLGYCPEGRILKKGLLDQLMQIG